MDISNNTDLNELKALCYDQLELLERTQRNVELLRRRIAQLQKEDVPKDEMVQ